MQNIIIDVMNNYGYIGMFLLIVLENIFPPIPSEIILLFSGFMSNYANLNIILLCIISTFASLIGALILYKIGIIFNVNKISKLFKIKISNIDKSILWFKEKGNISIFYCRFIPIVRSLISIPAGISKVNIKLFILYTFAGSLIWNSVLIYLGHLFSNNWLSVLNVLKVYSNVIAFLLIIVILFYSFSFYKKNKS